MIEFKCENAKEKWYGRIEKIDKYGTHYEMRVESRSELQVIFGCSSGGNFICLPDFNLGCHLAHLKDRFWNQEKLVSILGEVDGITITEALYNVHDLIQ